MGKNIGQLSYGIQLVEGLYTKYERVVKTQSVTG